MKVYRGVEEWFHTLLNLALNGDGSTSDLGHITLKKEPWITISEGWVGPRTRPDYLKVTILPLPGLELRTVQPAAYTAFIM
jgi:hypothetical protein